MLIRFPSGSSRSSLFRYWWMSSCGGSAHRFCGDWQSLQRPAALAAQTDPSGTEQTLSLQQQRPHLAPGAQGGRGELASAYLSGDPDIAGPGIGHVKQ